MGIIFHKYSTHSYSYAPYKSVRLQTINISKRASLQSTHKVPKRRRLAPSWDVVDDRPPHQLVHGGKWNLKQNTNIGIQLTAFENNVCELSTILFRPQCVYASLPAYCTATFLFQRSYLSCLPSSIISLAIIYVQFHLSYCDAFRQQSQIFYIVCYIHFK